MHCFVTEDHVCGPVCACVCECLSLTIIMCGPAFRFLVNLEHYFIKLIIITLQHLLGTCECCASLSHSEPDSHHRLVFISRNLCSTPDVGLNTPLHIVAKLGYMDIVEELLKDELLQQNHVKLNARNSMNKTPAHLAAEYGHYA